MKRAYPLTLAVAAGLLLTSLAVPADTSTRSPAHRSWTGRDHWAPANTVTSSLQVALPSNATVSVPLQGNQIDVVPLAGLVKIVARVTLPTDPSQRIDPYRVRVKINLNQVVGVGSVSRQSYTAFGSNRVNFNNYPVGAINLGYGLRASTLPQYSYLPLDISFQLNFNTTTGQLLSADIVSIKVSPGQPVYRDPWDHDPWDYR